MAEAKHSNSDDLSIFIIIYENLMTEHKVKFDDLVDEKSRNKIVALAICEYNQRNGSNITEQFTTVDLFPFSEKDKLIPGNTFPKTWGEFHNKAATIAVKTKGTNSFLTDAKKREITLNDLLKDEKLNESDKNKKSPSNKIKYNFEEDDITKSTREYEHDVKELWKAIQKRDIKSNEQAQQIESQQKEIDTLKETNANITKDYVKPLRMIFMRELAEKALESLYNHLKRKPDEECYLDESRNVWNKRKKWNSFFNSIQQNELDTWRGDVLVTVNDLRLLQKAISDGNSVAHDESYVDRNHLMEDAVDASDKIAWKAILQILENKRLVA